jgi:hypothetical protein
MPLTVRETRAFLRQARRQLARTETIALLVNKILAKANYMNDIVAQRFATEGASGGNRWRSLAPATIADRKRFGFAPGPILFRSGRLCDAAVNGDPVWDVESVRLRLKRRAAPKYVGKGRAKLRKAKDPKYARIEVYGYRLNQDRPFFQPPSGDEAVEMLKLRDYLISGAASVAANGGDPREWLEQQLAAYGAAPKGVKRNG